MEDERKTKKQLIEELNILRLEQIEQTKVTSEKFTKAFLQNSIPITITTVKEGRFVEVSDAFLRLVERKRDEVIGHTSRETGFITEEQRTLFHNELSKNGRVEDFEMEVTPKGRGLRYGLFNAVMISLNNENYFLTTIQDITDRKQADRFFKDVISKNPMSIQILDNEGFTLEVNLSFELLFGATPPSDYSIFNDIQLAKQGMGAIFDQLRNGEVVHIPDTYFNVRDSISGLPDVPVWVKTIGFPLNDSNQKPDRFILMHENITDRKRAEESLQKSEENYRLLAAYHKRLNDISIRFAEASGTEDLFNRIAESLRLLTGAIAATFSVYNQETRTLKVVSLSIDPISGDKVSSIFGQDLFEMLMPVSADDMEDMLNQGIRRPKDLCELSFGVMPQEISDAIMDAVGCRQIVALAISYVEELVGTCIAYLSEDEPVVPDEALRTYIYLSGLAVKRSRAQDALRESEQRMRLALEGTDQGLWDFDLLSTKVHYSDNWYKILGYGHEESNFDYEWYSNQIHPESSPVFEKALLDYISGHTKYLDWEYQIRNKSGEWQWIHALGIFTETDKTGLPVRMSGTHRNITDRKKAETEKATLEAQNRQLQKSESLGRMAGAVAHHFNNQLSVVIGNLEMAIDKQPKGAPPAKNLTAAMKAAWKAADMSGLMLTYLGQTHDNREPLDLSYSCRKILPLIKTTLPGNVVMKTDFPSPRPIIMANAGEIQQILTNLITNARETIGSNKGTISLSIKTVSPSEIPGKNRHPIDWQSLDKAYACLEVTDTGCGIEDKDIEQLFDPFFSTKFTGRGMGLAVVQGLVNSHKGVINVDSKPGSGSTFRLFFPVSEEALAQPQTTENDIDITISAPSSRKMEEGGTVLVVEDDEMLCAMATAMLESFGFTVLQAKDGIEGLEVFGKHRSEIKFVLTDLTMPRMNGWETLTALRKLQPDIPVILASGYDLAHVMAGDHPELPQAFLAKPYNLKALRNAVSQTLESRRG
jgi:PAS domain S-box-containing protein